MSCTKYSLRLNQNNPKHEMIKRVLEDLNKELYPTKNAFMVEALASYVDNILGERATNAGIQREESRKIQYVSREEYERDKISLKEDIRRELYEDMLRVMSSVVLNRAGPSEMVAFPTQGSIRDGVSSEIGGEKEVDLTQYDDIMKDIDAWSQD